MALPVYLKQQKEASVSVPSETITRKPDEGSEQSYDALESAGQDLIDAVKSGDAKLVAAALRSAFQICDLEPHEEGPHTEET
jgi:hypothetical protein